MEQLQVGAKPSEVMEMVSKPKNEWSFSDDFKNDPESMKLVHQALAFLAYQEGTDKIDTPIDFDLTIDGEHQVWQFKPSDAKLYDYNQGMGYDYNELGAARRFSALAKGHVMYDLTQQQWLVWTGVRWATLNRKQLPVLFNLVSQTAKIIRVEQVSKKVETSGGFIVGKSEQLLKQLGTYKGLSDILKLAKGEEFLGRSIKRYNDCDDILNCQNGEVDLTTGELKPHNPNHLFTKVAPVDYNPDAKCPTFNQLLQTTFNSDAKFISWMQLLLGESLKGRSRDQHFFIFYGPRGREGKSILTNIVSRILGYKEAASSSFATSAPVQLFMKAKFTGSGESATPGMARLDGSRFVTTTEPDGEAKFSEGIVKSLTGDDPITVRNLNQDPFTMFPSFTIIISTNALPGSDGSSAVMRRIVIVPFDHRVKEGSLEDDSELPEELWEEREGILSWLVSGSVKASRKREEAREQKKELRKKLKNGEIKEAPVVYEDTLRPFPAIVRQTMLQYKFGANSATNFVFDALLGKRETWNFLSSRLWSAVASGGFEKANKYFSSGSLTHDAILELGSPTLVFDKSAYVSCQDLYDAYKIWCKQSGERNPKTEKQFTKIVSSIFPRARIASGRIWLGIGLLPYCGYKGGQPMDVKGSYYTIIGGIGQDVTNDAKYEKSKLGDPEEIITRLVPDSGHQLSQRQQAKIDDFISEHGDQSFAGKYEDATVMLQDPMHPDIDLVALQSDEK